MNFQSYLKPSLQSDINYNILLTLKSECFTVSVSICYFNTKLCFKWYGVMFWKRMAFFCKVKTLQFCSAVVGSKVFPRCKACTPANHRHKGSIAAMHTLTPLACGSALRSPRRTAVHTPSAWAPGGGARVQTGGFACCGLRQNDVSPGRAESCSILQSFSWSLMPIKP